MSSEHWPWAHRLLKEAKSGAPQRQWRQAASHLCVLKDELMAARTHLTELLPLSPMSMSLHESITDLTAQLEGEEAAIKHWRDAAANFPHYQPLQERYAMALRDQPLETVRQVLEEIIRQTPDNAWAHRELAQHLLSAGRLDEAEPEVERAEQLDGEHGFCALLQATLAHRRGDTERSKTRLREMIGRDINGESAIAQLISLCQNADQVRQELQWLVAISFSWFSK